MIKKYASITVTTALLLLIWHSASKSNFAQGSIPPLTSVVHEALFDSRGAVLNSLLLTLRLVFLSVLAGVSLGLISGILIGVFYKYLSCFYYLANALKSMPVTVLIPVFLSVFGLEGFLLPLLALPTFVHLSSNVTSSVLSTNTKRSEIINLLDITKWSYAKNVLVYEIMPSIADTLRVVIPLTLAIEVALDYFLTANGGVGALIKDSYQKYNFSRMYAGIFATGTAGIMIVASINYIVSLTIYWK